MKEILREFIPCHKNLYLRYFSEQRLTQFTSRLLVTMIKKSKIDVVGNNFEELKINNSENNKSNRTDNKNSELLNQFRENYFSSRK